MRRYVTILFYTVLPFLSMAQSGFLQSYDLGEAGLTFHNMLLVEDTLILCGKIGVEQQQQWGLLFVKMDTFGNVLDHQIHFDDLGDNYSFEQGYQMIKTTDRGYALVGQMFSRQFPVLIKLDESGDLEWVQEYPDETVFNIRHWNVIETQHGFISVGVKQQMDDGYWDAFIMGTDNQGNKKWEVSYGEYGVWDQLRGINEINGNEFLVTGSTAISSSQVTDKADLWATAKAMKIDTLGNMTWEWEGEQTYAGADTSSTFMYLFPTSDGNWVNESSISTVLAPDEQAFQGVIAKRDTNFNVIWQTTFGQPTSNLNNFVNIAPCPDGGWVAVGQYVNAVEEDPLGGFRAAMIAKVNIDGDSLWSRLDTLFDHTMIASRPYLSGVVVLPSGSIFACGRVDKTFPSPSKSYGWLIKVDKDGCMEPGCNPMVNSTSLLPILEGFKVYPNPVVDQFTVTGIGRYNIDLINTNGQLLERYEDQFELTEMNISQYTSGVYFLRIRKGSTWLTKKIIKK